MSIFGGHYLTHSSAKAIGAGGSGPCHIPYACPTHPLPLLWPDTSRHMLHSLKKA